MTYLEPRVLRPFHRGEVLSIAEAAAIAGRAVRTFASGACFTTSAAASAGDGRVQGCLGHVARRRQGGP